MNYFQHNGAMSAEAASTPPQPPAQPWYRRAFQEEYLELYSHRDLSEAARAVEFLTAALALSPALRLLDLCCGPGRHLFFLHGRVGQACGLDLSRVLLARAAEHLRSGFPAEGNPAPAPPPPASLIQGTMSRLPLASASFDRVVNLFTSFGYYEDEARNRQVLREIARVLRRGGRFAIDHINREALLARLDPRSERRLPSGALLIEERQWDAAARRIRKRVTRLAEDGSQGSWHESVRVYEPA